VFASAVTGFGDVASDVILGGTAGATTVNITGGPSTYNVAVSGMTGDGTVTATILAGVATGSQSESNVASTSSDNIVTYIYKVPPVSYTIALPLVLSDTKPDLVASVSISPNKSTFTAGEPVVIQVTITNRGSATANPFWVDLYLNPSSPPTAANQTWNTRCGMPPCFGIAWQVTNQLAPGQSITLSSQNLTGDYSTWKGWFATGTTDLYVYADSYNPVVATGAVAESDETNNRAEIHGLSVSGTNPNLATLDIQQTRIRMRR
jgi:hypothetical protein